MIEGAIERGLRVGKFCELSAGHTLHYHESGTASAGKPSILFLHGSGPGASGYSNFKQNMPAFAAQGYHVLAVDYLGYGHSSKPHGIEYTTDLHISTIREFLAQKGIRRVVPVGNSLGGLLALQFTLSYPEEVPKLILMGPGGLDDPATFVPNSSGFAALRRWREGASRDQATFREVLANLVHDARHITDELVAERYFIALEQPAEVQTVRAPYFKERLHELQVPVLVFWGFYDKFLPVRLATHLLERAPSVRLIVSNKVGHWYMLEEAEDFNRQSLAFLAE